ncbi:nucleoside deaminase [Mycobacterium sp. OTB74]|jgi:tRNA(Arg) A34 adenosine deaminase TadA|uniref:nucleoside deaminase n=1 Tax=Mycobacterium sp. OTB74 TaxID=1853452 RepID=UPI0024739559|nr:nucleoside deaminase [Mycobacterium sp. OTB74]MDH6247958.1 tRNA(Arg) A34 adenosine deaminase TadA [Mycobacterium sp. OTB74]
MTVSAADLQYLHRCVELAKEALDDGDQPFGSLLTDAQGTVIFEDRNRVSGGDATRHPEFEIARWAAANLEPAQRATAVTYTSGEHCPMCSAAHAWVGLGRIVYATSSAQLNSWLTEWGVAPAPVAALPISAVAPRVPTAGPAPELAETMKELYRAAFRS